MIGFLKRKFPKKGYFAFYAMKDSFPRIYNVEKPMSFEKGIKYVNLFCEKENMELKGLYFDFNESVLRIQIKELSRQIM